MMMVNILIWKDGKKQMMRMMIFPVLIQKMKMKMKMEERMEGKMLKEEEKNLHIEVVIKMTLLLRKR